MKTIKSADPLSAKEDQTRQRTAESRYRTLFNHAPGGILVADAKKRTILLIEDNEKNRYLATFLLEQRGHQVVSAEDGPSGISLAQTLAPDLTLLDTQLPLMDGYAAARALRPIEMLRATAITAAISYAMVGDREKCLASGCNGRIEKPINPETFVAEIELFFRPHP